jgi:V/A-type H+-transporting ATPase subunit D
MAHLKVSPTRSNLMRIKRELGLAREGHDLLDRKREVLTMNLMRMAHDAEEIQQRMEQRLASAYGALDIATLTMGREAVEWAALATRGKVEMRMLLRSVMGVAVPTVEMANRPSDLPFGLGDTEAALDEAMVRFAEVRDLLPNLVETVASVWRLATELQKTQRRVNALERLFIPQYQETVKFSEEALEEKDREDYFRLKRVKALTAEKRDRSEQDA